MKTILFLGDSITDCGHSFDPDHLGYGYVRLISEKISDSQADKNDMYNKAIHVDSSEIFQYGMNTNVGNAFVYGDLKAVDTVTYPEIGGEYIFVKKVEKRYEKHEREVTKKDSTIAFFVNCAIMSSRLYNSYNSSWFLLIKNMRIR